MSPSIQIAFAAAVLAMSPIASATWLQGQVTEVRVVATGTPSEDKIVVFTTATTGCPQNGFFLVSSDAFFKESYALLLTAKAAGQTIKFDHVYCHANGLSRSNQYSVVN
jgi:hypothetical protein